MMKSPKDRNSKLPNAPRFARCVMILLFVANVASAGEKPVTLTISTDLAMLAFVVEAAEGTTLSPNISLNPARFPWGDRAITVTAEGNRLVFSVADFFGRNAMVKAGTGPLFTITADREIADIAISRIQAYDLRQQAVVIDTSP